MGFTAEEIMNTIGGRLVNLEDLTNAREWAKARIERPASLFRSGPSDLAFFFSRAFEHELRNASPGVLITGEDFVEGLRAAQLPLWKTSAVVACRHPYLAMARISELFAENLSSEAHLPSKSAVSGNGNPASRGKQQTQTSESKLEPRGLPRSDSDRQIHPSAVIAPTVELGRGVRIGPNCVIEDGTQIGSSTILYPGCYVGPRCMIGEDTVLFPRVTLYEGTQIGSRVRLHSGSVLGSDGFGYVPNPPPQAGHQKIYHLGRVVVEDDVEVGANSCVDRGTLGDTRIGKHSKLDNLVHVGHNSRLDEGAVICGGTCLAGNASVGKYAYVGGLSGIGNHVHVGDRARVGALTMVTKDVEPGGAVVGNPQRDSREHFRAHALLSKLLIERRSK